MNKQNKIIIMMITLGLMLIIIVTYLDRDKDIKDILTEDFVKCLGNNSILYIQTGCPHCQTQKDLFGDKIEFLTIINCIDEPEKCFENNINRIPAWEFDKINLVGIQTISLLENITGCPND